MIQMEKDVYGMSIAAIHEHYINGVTAKLSGTKMLVAGILSDCQEMLEHGYDSNVIRQQLNVAKYILFHTEVK